MEIQKVLEWHKNGEDYQEAVDLLRAEYIDVEPFRYPNPRNFQIVKSRLFALAGCNEFDIILANSEIPPSNDTPPSGEGEGSGEPPANDTPPSGEGESSGSEPTNDTPPSGEGEGSGELSANDTPPSGEGDLNQN